MIDFYNAFISYRHAELDSKVAEHVQRSLEHFHIPHAIRKKTGKKKIERIFRDKDELPITSDLTDTISNALEKADYLIVICSHNTCESIWVEREINFFLKNHSKNKILTVLADGEPTEVIPKILQQDERVVKDEDGTERTIKVNIEPLSCDYRMPLNKAKKLELPRLAAALIGCSYDELVRRQRAYRTKQIIAVSAVVAAAAIVFGGYMYRSKLKVDQALRQSLIDQNRYLAIQSNMLLEDDHRLDAIHLALAALPEDLNDEGAVTGEAMAALATATNAYVTQNGANIGPVWNYTTSGYVAQVAVNEDGTRMASMDTLGDIMVWDTESHENLFTVINSDALNGEIRFVDGDKFLVYSSGELSAYDSDTGENLWTLYSTERDDVMMFLNSDIQIVGEGRIAVCCGSKYLWIIDTESGEILEEYDVTCEIDGTMMYYSKFDLSPDGTKAALIIYNGFESSYVVMYDLGSRTMQVSDDFERYVSNSAWYDDDHYLVSVYIFNGDESSVLNNTYYLTENETEIYCYDPSNLDLLWSAPHSSTGYSLHRSFLMLPAIGCAAFYNGASCTAYNIADGNIEYNWVTNDSIIDISDRDGNGYPLIITTNGGMALPSLSMGGDVIGLTYEFASDLYDAVVNHGVYTFQDFSNEIIYYNSGVYDEEWEAVEDTMTPGSRDYYMDDDILAVLSGLDEPTLLLIDPNTNELMHEVQITNDAESYYGLNILGVYDGKLYIADSCGSMILHEIDLERGTETSTVICDDYTYMADYTALENGRVYYLHHDVNEKVFGIYDIESENTEEFTLNVDSFSDLQVIPTFIDDMDLIYVAAHNMNYMIDTTNGNEIRVDLPEGSNDIICVVPDVESEHVVVANGSDIMFVNRQGDVDYSVSTEGKHPVGIDILTNEEDGTRILVAAYANGSLGRYDPDTGAVIGMTDISSYIDHLTPATFQPDWDNGYLYIQFDMLTDVINMNTWYEEAYLTDCFGHHIPTDRFYCTSSAVAGEEEVGYFRHYTVQELVDRAYAIVGEDAEMPEYLRARYGL